jgi:hypothetical protein
MAGAPAQATCRLGKILPAGSKASVWALMAGATLLLVGGVLTGHWLVVAGGLVLLGCAGLLRPASWVAALVSPCHLPMRSNCRFSPDAPGHLGCRGDGGWLSGRDMRCCAEVAGGGASGSSRLIVLLAGLASWALVASVVYPLPRACAPRVAHFFATCCSLHCCFGGC